MACPEIEKLREYLESGNLELRIEEKKLTEQIESETSSFFSRYDRDSIDETMVNEFRESLRNIYSDSLKKKYALLEDVRKKIDRIEGEYMKDCA